MSSGGGSYLKLKFWWAWYGDAWTSPNSFPVLLLPLPLLFIFVTLVFSLCSSPQHSSFRTPSCELNGSSTRECVVCAWNEWGGEVGWKQQSEKNETHASRSMQGRAAPHPVLHPTPAPPPPTPPETKPRHQMDKRRAVVPWRWLTHGTCASRESWQISWGHVRVLASMWLSDLVMYCRYFHV